MSNHGLECYEFESWDGTVLRAYRGGNPDGPPLVICNGLGGNVCAWTRVIGGLASRFRVLSWDYRGLHCDGPTLEPGTFTLAHHARDLVALLHHECAASPILAARRALSAWR